MRNFAYLYSLVVAMMSSMTLALPLLPMAQTYQVDKGGTINEQFLVSSSGFTVFVTGANGGEIVLKLPDGTTITEINAGTHNISWITEINETSGDSLITIQSNSAVSGAYSITVNALANEMAGVSVIEDSGLQYLALIGEPSKQIIPNKLVPIAVVLYHTGSPALGATISVDLIDPTGGIAGQLLLKDDGQSHDHSQGDGVYTAITSFNSTGTYQALIDANWNGRVGLVSNSIFVSAKEVTLSGQYSVTTVDTDNDGLFSHVTLTFEDLTPRLPGEYTVTVEIMDADGNTAIDSAIINQPEAPLSVDIGVDKLKLLSTQPWEISSISIWKAPKIIGYWENLGFITVDTSKFEREPLIVGGISNDYGIDNDGDGLYERLVVEVSIDTEVAGSYVVSADLRSPTNAIIGDAWNSKLDLVAGLNSVKLSFLGSNVGGCNEDGHYQLTNFLIYPNFSTSIDLTELVPVIGETKVYLCNKFVGCGSDLEAETVRIANKLCNTHQRRLLSMLNRIVTQAKTNPEAAEKKLQQLYSRALDLQASGTCVEETFSSMDN